MKYTPEKLFNLAGKTVLVAGGAGYLGLPLCRAILAHGGNICLADFNEENLSLALTQLREEFPEAGILAQAFDVGDEASIVSTIKACMGHFGGLSGLVNATFGGTAKRLEELSGKDFDQANHLNLTGSFLLAREAANHMQNKGSIIMYASMYGLVAPNPANYPGAMNPNPIEYGAGKAGMIQMVRYLAAHFGAQDIRVNAIAPGPFPNQAKHKLPEEFTDNLSRSTMLGRVGVQHETAGPTVFLLSDAASYVTGQVLSVDGGWTSW